MTPKDLKHWLLPLIWAAMILLASSDLFSANHTSRFIEPILHWLFPAWSAAKILRAHFIIRKLAHLTEYGILGLLVARALLAGRANEIRRSAWSYVPVRAILLCGTVAAADEFHQSFVPSRTGSPKDVLLDVVGAALFIRLAMGWKRWRNGRRSEAIPQR